MHKIDLLTDSFVVVIIGGVMCKDPGFKQRGSVVICVSVHMCLRVYVCVLPCT